MKEMRFYFNAPKMMNFVLTSSCGKDYSTGDYMIVSVCNKDENYIGDCTLYYTEFEADYNCQDLPSIMRIIKKRVEECWKNEGFSVIVNSLCYDETVETNLLSIIENNKKIFES